MRRVLIGLIFAAAAAALGRRFLPVRLRPSTSEELSNLTKDELYKRAQAADIPHRSEMTKEELIDSLARR